ncbi:MAG: hypothetical protein HY550_10565 [Elusimicrobia bacterium]|nr:hypothetical protein [Elusimicrobiota bacterium]
MKIIRITFAALFASFALGFAAYAAELNTLNTADIKELSADLAVPAPPPAPALEEALIPKNGLDPVIITVPGLRFGEIGWGSLEIRNILRFFQFFFRNKELSEADIASGLVAFNPLYFFPKEDREEEELLAASDLDRMPDDYLEQKLKEIPGYAEHNVVITPFAWSRDPGDTRKTVPQLQALITEVHDSYKGSGRPVYILAHSWGSVLSHTALHRVARARPDVRIEKFITAGSPLVPGNFITKLFVKLEALKGGLRKRVTKPSNVGAWRNFWAARDAYSNAIPAADSNYQADANVEKVEPLLLTLILHNKLLKKQALRDLFKVRDIKAWHGSYFFDYQASLKSISREIDIAVFKPELAPHVIQCSESPMPLCAP